MGWGRRWQSAQLVPLQGRTPPCSHSRIPRGNGMQKADFCWSVSGMLSGSKPEPACAVKIKLAKRQRARSTALAAPGSHLLAGGGTRGLAHMSPADPGTLPGSCGDGYGHGMGRPRAGVTQARPHRRATEPPWRSLGSPGRLLGRASAGRSRNDGGTREWVGEQSAADAESCDGDWEDGGSGGTEWDGRGGGRCWKRGRGSRAGTGRGRAGRVPDRAAFLRDRGRLGREKSQLQSKPSPC